MTPLSGSGLSTFLLCLMLCLLETAYPKDLSQEQVAMIDAFEAANPHPVPNPVPAKEATVACSNEEECSRNPYRVGRSEISTMLLSCKEDDSPAICRVFLGRKRRLDKHELSIERRAPQPRCPHYNPACRFNGRLKEIFKRTDSIKDPELADDTDSEDAECDPSQLDCRAGRKRSISKRFCTEPEDLNDPMCKWVHAQTE
ncbi:uncharacterized protein [Porites lutea]|uniref:uncharacterized protein n=1 Tax=Porites lutea TaxID=51062 RepID=UPI003CC5ACD2